MDRGSLGALNYRIPPNQQVGVNPLLQQAGLSPVEAQMPEIENDPIAVREKLTNDYYNNYGMLNAFVLDNAKKGIDVTTPNYAEDGGGVAFQTFQKMVANQQFAVNRLKNELQREQQVQPYLLTNRASLAPGFDPTKDLYTEDPNAVVSNEALPFVQESNIRSRERSYTAADTRRLNQATAQQAIARINQMEQSGQLSKQAADVQRANVFQATQDTSYQQLIPRTGRGGLTQEDVSRRAELIKQIKQGIVTNDQTPINILRQAQGVRGVKYVNTGDRIGIEVDLQGEAPAFFDLSQGASEGEINALLNRIEGQKNVPNEAVFSFDTKVNIPKSNVKLIIDDVKSKLSLIPEDDEAAADVVEKLKALASQGKINLPEGQVFSIEPDYNLLSKNDLVIKYYPRDVNGKINYSKPKTKRLFDPQKIKDFVDYNSTEIAPEFGGGFVTQTPEQQRAADIKRKYGIQ